MLSLKGLFTGLRNAVRPGSAGPGGVSAAQRFWARPHVHAFICVMQDGEEGRPLSCLLGGIQTPVLVKPDNPRYDEIRRLLLNSRHNDSIRVLIDLEEPIIIWAEATDEEPEFPLMEFHEMDEGGDWKVFIPGPPALPKAMAARTDER
ncbi:MAG: hypothetical protein K2X49_26180 [Acetobacteraceae bacterium]|nr:hypothetical protein [Acetobacteraceae bacterium]